MRQMAYRPHFFMMIAGKIIRMGLLFLFFQAIFLKVDRIGTWTCDQVLLLFATFHIVDFLMSITFQRNLSFYLPRWVQTGELDFRLLLPLRPLFLVSFENIDLMDFFSFLPSLGFLGYVLFRLDFTFSWKEIVAYVFLVFNALLFLYAAILMIAALSFWTVQSYGLAKMFDNLLKIGRYPLDILGGVGKIVFFYFLPLALIAQVPTQVLLKIVSYEYVVYSLIITGFFFFLAIKFWRLGIKSYVSASS